MAPSASTQSPAKTSGSSQTNLKRVLLVEDHVPSLRAMSRLLRKSGFDVRSATDFEQAVSLANEGPVDLLITDLMLPTRSGWELLGTLASRRPLAAIAISSYTGDAEIARSHEAGFLAHLVKPIDLNKLSETLARVAGPRAA